MKHFPLCACTVHVMHLLSHPQGPYFPPLYEPLPKHVKFLYDGKPVSLTPDTEEVRMYMHAVMHCTYIVRYRTKKNYHDHAYLRVIITQEQLQSCENRGLSRKLSCIVTINLAKEYNVIMQLCIRPRENRELSHTYMITVAINLAKELRTNHNKMRNKNFYRKGM